MTKTEESAEEYRARKTAIGMRKLHKLMTTEEFSWLEVVTKEDSSGYVVSHTVYVHK